MMKRSAQSGLMMGAPRIASRSDGRDNNFNLIRILAAGGVLISHAYPISQGAGARQPLETTLHGLTLGTLCLWVFFAISGFFITRSFDRKRSVGSFLTARALRLLPALITVTIITIAVAGLLLSQAPPTLFWAEADDYFIRSLLLFKLKYDLPGVFEANPYGPAINGSLWSLSYEVTCYAGVFLCGLLGFLTRKQIFAGFAALFLGAYAITMTADLHTRLEQMAQLGLPFLTGMIFYIWRDHIPLSWGILAGLVSVAGAAWFTPVFLPVFAIVLSYAVFVIGYAKSPVWQRYNLLGDYSYGLYIYAFPVQQLVAQTGITAPVTNIAIAAPCTLICAVLSWHLIEFPALKLRIGSNGLLNWKLRRPTK